MKGQDQLFASARTVDGRDGGSTDEWQTPQAFYALMHEEFAFTLDPCASRANAKAAFFSKERDGLAQDWGRNVCFVNFPYSQAKAWAAKCADAADKGAVVVVLCASRTDTGWFHLLAKNAAEVRFVRGRLSFVNPDGESASAPFPSCVIVLAPSLEQVEHEGVAMPSMALWDVPAEVRR